MTQFNARRFLDDNFQSPQRVIASLQSFGLPSPNSATVEKWFSRGSVPSDWLPMLLAVVELDQGKPVSVAGYVEGEGA